MEDDVSDGALASSPATVSGRKTAPDRIGARLAAARVAAKLELIDIARETRVPLRHLKAIEADAHDELPAMPYAVGFVKSLARAVGMDPDEAGQRFRAETTMIPHTPMAASLEPLDERRLPSRGMVMASVAGLVLLLGGLTAYGAGWFDTPVHSTVAATTAGNTTAPVELAPAPGTDGAPLVSGDTAVTPAAATTAVSPTAAPAAGASSGVTIVASDDAWIRVYRTSPTTGRPEAVKTGLMVKGERYNVPAEPGLKLWTGRAGALHLTVDGRTLPPLGGPAETVRNVSLDAPALRARLVPASATAATAPAPNPSVR
ncbi:helix-turn-helix domain-containing protein [Sphingosinicellaceae bacterium]|nr:helix-turn-helix domain-containing protein [Sphingosinicellaceae bacterium]